MLGGSGQRRAARRRRRRDHHRPARRRQRLRRRGRRLRLGRRPGATTSTARAATTSSPAAPATTSSTACPATTRSPAARATTTSKARPATTQLHGGAGKDIVSAAATTTRLDGGTGDDVMYGGHGRDTSTAAAATTPPTARTRTPGRRAPGRKGRGQRRRQYIEIKGSAEFQERVRADLDMMRASPIGQQMLAEQDDIHNDSAAIAADWPVLGGDLLSGQPVGHRGGRLQHRLLLHQLAPRRGLQDHLQPEPPDSSDERPPIAGLFHEMAHVYDYGNNTSAEGNHVGGVDDGVENDEREAVGLPIDHDDDPSTPNRSTPTTPTTTPRTVSARRWAGRPESPTLINKALAAMAAVLMLAACSGGGLCGLRTAVEGHRDQPDVRLTASISRARATPRHPLHPAQPRQRSPCRLRRRHRQGRVTLLGRLRDRPPGRRGRDRQTHLRHPAQHQRRQHRHDRGRGDPPRRRVHRGVRRRLAAQGPPPLHHQGQTARPGKTVVFCLGVVLRKEAPQPKPAEDSHGPYPLNGPQHLFCSEPASVQ